MLQQPMRLGGLALVCALATSALVLVTFLASNLVLSVIGGIGPGDRAAADQQPAAAVLLSSQRQTERQAERQTERQTQRQPADGATRCDRRPQREPGADQRSGRDADPCAGQRGGAGSPRP